tara:strand:- start:3571 stop:3702 length:132 start_codon:yes stop_codon:yes gene_type:complete
MECIEYLELMKKIPLLGLFWFMVATQKIGAEYAITNLFNIPYV